MTTLATPLSVSPATTTPVTATVSLCPFHDGAATLDGLLAEIDARDTATFDAALDLRSLLADGRDAEACLATLFHLRALLDGRHYLAFYRVRRWVQRRLVAQTRAARNEPWRTRELPLDAARLDELTNSCLAALAAESSGELPFGARVRFAFRENAPAIA